MKALIDQAAKLFAENNMRKPSRDDWEACFRILAFYQKMEYDARDLGETVWDAEERYPHGITNDMAANLISGGVGGQTKTTKKRKRHK
jgi:hypothetical protein